jgi:hypothetical protein
MTIDIYERSMLVCKNSTSTKQECLQQAQTKQAGQDMPAGQADGPGEEMCLLCLTANHLSRVTNRSSINSQKGGLPH